MNIAVTHETTMLTLDQIRAIAAALQRQVTDHFYPVWERHAAVYALEPGQTVPPGTGALRMLDTSDEPGALGYHDEDAAEVLWGMIFCKTTIENGGEPSEVASHELLEALVDPHVNDTCIDTRTNRLYAKEVGDPCQGHAYEVEGITVADFALPNWFDPRTADDAPTSYTGALKGPFTRAPEGYVSWIDLSNPSAGWQQEGAEHAYDGDDRVARRPGS